MITGSCLCGGIVFEVDERAIVLMNNCHCSQCRKSSGSAYGVFAQIGTRHFRFVSGQELIAGFQSSAHNVRTFCRVCGSRAPMVRASSGAVTIPAGLLDADPGQRACVNLYVGSKAPWHTISDALPAFEEMGGADFWQPFFERATDLAR